MFEAFVVSVVAEVASPEIFEVAIAALELMFALTIVPSSIFAEVTASSAMEAVTIVPKDITPLPSVFKTVLADPSAAGKVNSTPADNVSTGLNFKKFAVVLSLTLIYRH